MSEPAAPNIEHNPQRDPDEWLTGDEPSTGPQESYLHTLAQEAGAFAVNILSEGQQDVAYRFARKGDKFGDLEHDTGRRGVPVLRDTLAHLECEVGETVTFTYS